MKKLPFVADGLILDNKMQNICKLTQASQPMHTDIAPTHTGIVKKIVLLKFQDVVSLTA